MINGSMNKITSSNYLTIMNEINDTLMQDNFRKLPDYCKFLFDIIIKKCLNEENFSIDYLRFLTAFNETIGININTHITELIDEIFKVIKNDNVNTNSGVNYFSYIKDVSQYFNIGIIFANLYIIKNDYNLTSNISKISSLSHNNVSEKIMVCLNQINNYLEWLPHNMDELYKLIYLLFGIIEMQGQNILSIMSQKDLCLLNDVLNLIYTINNIPNKIKFKVLDIQDIIKTFEKTKKQSEMQNILKYEPPKKLVEIQIEQKIEQPLEQQIEQPLEDSNEYETATINLDIQKPKIINKKTSSIKLVNMHKNNVETKFVDNVVAKVESVSAKVESVVAKVESVSAKVESVAKVENVVAKVENVYKNNNKYKNRQQNNQPYNNQQQNNQPRNNQPRNNQQNRQHNNQQNRQHNNQQNKQQPNRQQPKQTVINNDNDNDNKPNLDDDGFIKIERKQKIINKSNN
jgi:hypothetical protein